MKILERRNKSVEKNGGNRFCVKGEAPATGGEATGEMTGDEMRTRSHEKGEVAKHRRERKGESHGRADVHEKVQVKVAFNGGVYVEL